MLMADLGSTLSGQGLSSPAALKRALLNKRRVTAPTIISMAPKHNAGMSSTSKWVTEGGTSSNGSGMDRKMSGMSERSDFSKASKAYSRKSAPANMMRDGQEAKPTRVAPRGCYA